MCVMVLRASCGPRICILVSGVTQVLLMFTNGVIGELATPIYPCQSQIPWAPN